MARADLKLMVEVSGDKTIVVPRGDWLTCNLAQVEKQLQTLCINSNAQNLIFDLSDLAKIDMAGAFALSRLVRASSNPNADHHFIGSHPYARKLMKVAHENSNVCLIPPAKPYFIDILARVGRATEDMWGDFVGTLAFAGRLFQTLFNSILHPSRLRWAAISSQAEEVGINALPIVAVLSFFMGAVLAFLSANLLSSFGASLFTVDLVGVAVLREFAVVITAVILAGRSNSAFTAQIGSMKMQQEIDAMKVLGIDPFEALVIPRVLACVFTIPLLVFTAMITGLLGGGLVTLMELDISPNLFISRMHEVVAINHFWVGMSKAPVFALIIALIGCRQGLLVGGDVESLGRRTTMSVVQALFSVILVDAIFAMVYMELDI